MSPGVIIAFFISNPISQYYKSDRFANILENITLNHKLFELKQNDNRLRVFVRNVDSLSKAYDILKKLELAVILFEMRTFFLRSLKNNAYLQVVISFLRDLKYDKKG